MTNNMALENPTLVYLTKELQLALDCYHQYHA